MTSHSVGTPEEHLQARLALLAAEKEHTRRGDELARQRRQLPWVRVEKTYVLDTVEGEQTLTELFDGRSQLLVYHFMFGPEWSEGCPVCSYWADNFDNAIVHLNHRDITMVCASRAPIERLEAYRQRMGWSFPWVSSSGTDFNYDFHVTLDSDVNSVEYNYANAADLVKAGKLWSDKGELPGLSVFLREGNTVFHTYSVYQRGLDLPLNTYNFLDLTPLGRQEEDGRIQAWIRHHDRYPARA